MYKSLLSMLENRGETNRKKQLLSEWVALINQNFGFCLTARMLHFIRVYLSFEWKGKIPFYLRASKFDWIITESIQDHLQLRQINNSKPGIECETYKTRRIMGLLRD